MTLIEVLAALVFLSLLGHAVWSTAHAAGETQLSTWREADAGNALADVERILRDALEAAGHGMPSSPNLGGVHVLPADEPRGDRDTLVVLRADGPAIRTAARACPDGEAGCILLMGDHAGLASGDLLVAGSPATGARLLQVSDRPTVVDFPCGADCPERLVCSLETDPESAPGGMRVEVAGAVLDGRYVEGAACDQPYSPAGECRERLRVASTRRSAPVCAAEGRTQIFTQVPVVDRTAIPLGYPLSPAAVMRSGGEGTPLVRTQKVRVSRFWVRDGAHGGELVRQTGLTPAGTWAEPLPIAGPVGSLRVEGAHRSDGTWIRGTGVDQAMLTWGGANHVRRTVPTADALPASEYARGYHTLGAVRVTFVVPRREADGGHTPIARRMVVSTTHGLDGGSDGG